MEKKRKSTDETSLKSPPKRKAAKSGRATQPEEKETDRQEESKSDRETKPATMGKKQTVITSYFRPKPKAAENGSATQPPKQDTDRQGEKGSDRETKQGATLPQHQQKSSAPVSSCRLDKKKQAPLTQHQQESSASVSSPDLNKKSTEPHVTHSFMWSHEDGKRTYSCTCDKAGTIEEVLRRSPEFEKIQDKKKRQDKELVVKKDGKAISSHFPCCLIKDDHLTVKFIKAGDKEKSYASGSRSRQRKPPSNKLVTFHVLTKGGENIQRVMNNLQLAKNVGEATVYAYEGEKVKHALHSDIRFLSTIFKTKTCALSETSTETTVELSSLVDHHDGKTFQIVQLSTSAPPSSLDSDWVQNETEVSPSDENQDPAQHSTSTELEKVDKPKPDDNMSTSSGWSKNLQDTLTSIFNEAVKSKKSQRASKLSNIQNLFRAEFGKNEEACNEVKTMKKMMEHSDSVCFIRTDQRAKGTGFLLFDKFVLTNGHVLKNIYDESTGKLTEKVIVHFSYESLGELGPAVEVRNVVGCELGSDGSEQAYDWALLELSEGQKLPSGLLQHFGFPFQSGGICIIGHPDDKVKKIDACFVVPANDRDQVVKRHRQENPDNVVIEGSHYGLNPGPCVMLTDKFFGNVEEYIKRSQDMTYESCFYQGSSGSPVFDEHCKVVAMHSGGFTYKDKKGNDNSVIEFGHPLYIIVKRLIIQLMTGKNTDLLKQCLTNCSEQNLNKLKDLVKKEHLKEDFQFALLCLFECISQKEEPMEIDSTYIA